MLDPPNGWLKWRHWLEVHIENTKLQVIYTDNLDVKFVEIALADNFY